MTKTVKLTDVRVKQGTNKNGKAYEMVTIETECGIVANALTPAFGGRIHYLNMHVGGTYEIELEENGKFTNFTLT